MTKKHHTEVLIVGAGPAGAALAVWLARKGVECLLVDRARFPRRKPCASCFSPLCLPWLRDLGLEGEVRTGQRIRYIEVQSPKSFLRFDTANNPLGSSFHVFPRIEFDRLLVEKARALGVPLLEGIPVESLVSEGGAVVGARGNGMEFRARVTVVATGSFTRFLPAEHRPDVRTYQTLIGWYEGVADLDPLITDSFTAPWLLGSGWVFPESPRSANVGIMVHEALRKASRASLRELFEAYCETPFVKKRLKGAKRAGPLRGSPIRYSLRPKGICGDGFLMVGEACLLTQPLTGEGISQALSSAALAAEVLGRERGTSPCRREQLRPYEDGIRERFGRDFRKAGFLRRWLDRPVPLEAGISLVRRVPGLHAWIEKRLHRVVL